MKLAKTYEPNQYQQDIYQLWEQSGAFSPNLAAKESFSIVMPPLNANADAHIGHSLMFAIQDVMVRYQRMLGKAVVWVPGVDHAGFETQVVYEKQLTAQGKSRFDFTREELFSQIFDFVGQNKSNLESQFRSFGASADWTRTNFTLDDNVVNTAYASFKKMWDDGLIYRGERLVNYCTQHRTGFADIEVAYQEKESPLYYLQYGPFVLATTRPETKFGDTAVAVNPKDDRYKEYVGKVLTVDGLNGPFELRVVADEMVDINFGTGVVKITPAHDFNDWEVAQRHNLEAVRVINHDGTMNHRAGQYEGMTIADARTAVVKALEEKGLLVKIDKHYKNRVGTCYKCGTVIEPMLMEQWFIDMPKLAKPAIAALKKDKITFYPANKRDQVITYLKNVKDWNISRQIAWGIPIPAFQNVDDADDWIFDTRVTQEIITIDGKNYRRDPDVFDTWFSSGHWPFVTLGYPDSADFKRFYPNSVMETGQDILYPWVARMITIGLYITGDIPFKDVYLHGMVRGEDGRKMSKSLGNVINPKEVLEAYGSDALRMGMLSGRSAGYSAAYAPSKIIAGRNFCNKLWNIARYIETIEGDGFSRETAKPLSLADHWILQQTALATTDISNLLNEYRFSEAYNTLYHFVWDDVADWYIESSKISPNKQLLAEILEIILKLAHPFAPFVTETIWQTLEWTGDSLLISAQWPQAPSYDKKQASGFSEIQKIVGEVRYITTALDVKFPGLYFKNSSFLKDNANLIKKLARLNKCDEVESGRGMHLTQTTLDCWLDIDIATAKKYVTKLNVTKLEREASIGRLEMRLGNKSYTNKAPATVVQQTKDQLHQEQALLAKLELELQTFTSLS